MLELHVQELDCLSPPFVSTIQDHFGSDDVKNDVTRCKEQRPFLYNGKWHARRFSADTVAQYMCGRQFCTVPSPRNETHIRKLFHVHLNRIVGYRICCWLGTEKAPRRCRAAIASSVEEIEVLLKHARLPRGSLYACLDLMSCVLCESY